LVLGTEEAISEVSSASSKMPRLLRDLIIVIIITCHVHSQGIESYQLITVPIVDANPSIM